MLRPCLAAVVLSAGWLVGCSHQSAPPQHAEPSAPQAESEPAPPREERVVIAEAPAEAPVVDTRPEARPRLTRTITLGETESYGPQPVQAQAAGPQQPVVVNNITVVQQQAPAVFGGWGYGGYGYRGHGAGTMAPSQATSRAAGWSHDSWGGAQRTAAPGRTPGVGGNWAPAPSYGPRAMR